MPSDTSRQMMCQDVLDYYSKIMQFRGIQNPPGRFQAICNALCRGGRQPDLRNFFPINFDCSCLCQVVVPENINLKDKMSLTQAYSSHAVLAQCIERVSKQDVLGRPCCVRRRQEAVFFCPHGRTHRAMRITNSSPKSADLLDTF